MKSKKWKVLLVTTVFMALMCSQVFASVGIAPSITQKAAPTISGGATYTDANGNVVTISNDKITVTSDADLANLSAEDRAYYEAALSLISGSNEQFLADLDAFAKSEFPNYDENTKFVAKEIFDINVEGSDLVFDSGEKLTLTMEGNYQPGDFVILLVFNKELGKWDFIPSEDITINDDGSLTVNFPHLCPVAIMVEDTESDSSTASTTVDSTDKNAGVTASEVEAGGSSMSTPVMVSIAGAGILLLAVAVTVLKKKKSA